MGDARGCRDTYVAVYITMTITDPYSTDKRIGMSEKAIMQSSDTLFSKTRRAAGMRNDTYRILKPSDEVVPVLLLLETSKRHLGTRDVLWAGDAHQTIGRMTWQYNAPF